MELCQYLNIVGQEIRCLFVLAAGDLTTGLLENALQSFFGLAFKD